MVTSNYLLLLLAVDITVGARISQIWK